MNIKSQYDDDKVFVPFVAAQRSDFSYRKNLHKMLGDRLKDLKILDLGCGSGIDLKYLVTCGGKVYGVDASQKMVKLAQKNVPQAEIKRADLKQLPFQDNFFDLIYCQFVAVHEANLNPAFAEVFRVLKPGGNFVLLATHPLKQYLEKNTKDYFRQEEYIDRFFDNTVAIDVFSHTLQEYLSPFILHNFRLVEFVEQEYVEDQQVPDILYPAYMILKLQRVN